MNLLSEKLYTHFLELSLRNLSVSQAALLSADPPGRLVAVRGSWPWSKGSGEALCWPFGETEQFLLETLRTLTVGGFHANRFFDFPQSSSTPLPGASIRPHRLGLGATDWPLCRHQPQVPRLFLF